MVVDQVGTNHQLVIKMVQIPVLADRHLVAAHHQVAVKVAAQMAALLPVAQLAEVQQAEVQGVEQAVAQQVAVQAASISSTKIKTGGDSDAQFNLTKFAPD